MEPQSRDELGLEKDLVRDREVERILLEMSSGRVSLTTKTDLALVHLGLKPATYFEVALDPVNQTQKDASFYYRKDVGAVQAMLLHIGLPYIMARGSDLTKFIVGDSIEEVNTLRDAYMLPDSPERTRRFGLAIGYPETAVNAYLHFLYDNDQAATVTPADVGRQDLGKINVFRLSRDNWQEEIKQMDQATSQLKIRMPQLYEVVERIE